MAIPGTGRKGHLEVSNRFYGASKASTLTGRRPSTNSLPSHSAGDPCLHDRHRVQRIRSFLNCKYNPVHSITVAPNQ